MSAPTDTAIPSDIAALLAMALEEMRDRTGSITWHFKDGRVLKVEHRTFSDARPGKGG